VFAPLPVPGRSQEATEGGEGDFLLFLCFYSIFIGILVPMFLALVRKCPSRPSHPCSLSFSCFSSYCDYHHYVRVYDVVGNDVVVTRGAAGLRVSWGPFLPGAPPRKPLIHNAHKKNIHHYYVDKIRISYY
jgi:hypothetical protein